MPSALRVVLVFLLSIVGWLSHVAIGQPAHAEEARFIRIATGPIGGTYFPIGGLIANVISGPPGSMACDQGGSCGVPGLIAAAVSTQGSVENVKDMTDGSVELVLCQANIAYDAFTGSGLYSGKPNDGLRAIANLFPEAVHVVVRRADDFKSIADLKGKRVAVGETDSGTLATAKIVLRSFGLSFRSITPVYEKLARSADMLINGDVDAFFMVGGEPIGAIARSAERIAIALLPITGKEAERIIKAQPFFTPAVIPADTYQNVPATETISVGAQLLVAATTHDDLVFAITEALWDPRNRKVLDVGNPIARRIQLKTALTGLSVPLHPGAERYYKNAETTQGE
jgi:uncharacterized protein